MRATIHNGRTSKDGAYNTKHNDRQFDIRNAEHIDPEQSRGNRYWRWNQQDTPEQSFENCEQEFYERTFADYLQAQNQRHIDNRHPGRVKTMEQYRQSRLGRPEQVIMEIGNSRTGAPDPDTLWTIIKAQLDWEKKTFPAVRVLDIALHVDEPDSAPHIHVARVWIAHDKDGHPVQQQEGALREMGVQKPLPDSVESRDRLNRTGMNLNGVKLTGERLTQNNRPGFSLATGEATDADVRHLRFLFFSEEIVRQFTNNRWVHYDTHTCVHCSLSKLSKY